MEITWKMTMHSTSDMSIITSENEALVSIIFANIQEYLNNGYFKFWCLSSRIKQ